MNGKKTLIILMLAIILLSACSNKKGKMETQKIIAQDFEQLLIILKEAVKNKDITMIDKITSDDFCYNTPLEEEKYNYSREEAVEHFDFELVERLLSAGYVITKNGKSAYAPPINKMEEYKYAISFWNDGKGWLITSIYSGQIGGNN